MATAALNNVATQANYENATTIGPDDFDYITYFVYNATCVAQSFDVGPGGDWQTGNWGPEQLLAPSSGMISKTGGVRFKTNPATPATPAQIIAYGFKSGNSQWIGGQPLTQTINSSGTVTNGGTMITGMVTVAGAVSAGTGFSASNGGAGLYTVTFTTAFPATPIVVATINDQGGGQGDGTLYISSVSATAFSLATFNTSFVAQNRGFSFLAVQTV